LPQVPGFQSRVAKGNVAGVEADEAALNSSIIARR